MMKNKSVRSKAVSEKQDAVSSSGESSSLSTDGEQPTAATSTSRVVNASGAVDPWAERVGKKAEQALDAQDRAAKAEAAAAAPARGLSGRYYDLVRDRRRANLPYDNQGSALTEELEFYNTGESHEYDDTAQFSH